jgi:hypothetical protein
VGSDLSNELDPKKEVDGLISRDKKPIIREHYEGTVASVFLRWVRTRVSKLFYAMKEMTQLKRWAWKVVTNGQGFERTAPLLWASDWWLAASIRDSPRFTHCLPFLLFYSTSFGFKVQVCFTEAVFADDLIEASILRYFQEVGDKFCSAAEGARSLSNPSVTGAQTFHSQPTGGRRPGGALVLGRWGAPRVLRLGRPGGEILARARVHVWLRRRIILTMLLTSLNESQAVLGRLFFRALLYFSHRSSIGIIRCFIFGIMPPSTVPAPSKSQIRNQKRKHARQLQSIHSTIQKNHIARIEKELVWKRPWASSPALRMPMIAFKSSLNPPP